MLVCLIRALLLAPDTFNTIMAFTCILFECCHIARPFFPPFAGRMPGKAIKSVMEMTVNCGPVSPILEVSTSLYPLGVHHGNFRNNLLEYTVGLLHACEHATSRLC